MNGDYILDVARLPLEGSFQQQVTSLLEYVRRTRAEVEGLYCLYQDIQDTLCQVWPECRVHAFGSVVTGLAIKTSDADIFVEVSGNSTDTVRKVLDAKHMLRCYPHLFANLFAITQAKVPIVKFLHIPTQTQCDVSFSSFAGAANSEFIGCMLRHDHRALQLAIIIKYWSTVHYMTGTNLLPNYALIQLIIFYLQHVKILPSVYHLQINMPRSKLIDNWNYTTNKINAKTSNKQSLLSLLGGFFTFYRDFNFLGNIVSTYLGYSVERSMFQSLQSVPEEFSLYRKNVEQKLCRPLKIDTNFCIQDSFEHSRNCAVAVHNRLFASIKAHIDLAAEIYVNCSSEPDQFLYELLTQKPPNHYLAPRKQQGNFKFFNNRRGNKNVPRRNLRPNQRDSFNRPRGVVKKHVFRRF